MPADGRGGLPPPPTLLAGEDIRITPIPSGSGVRRSLRCLTWHARSAAVGLMMRFEYEVELRSRRRSGFSISLARPHHVTRT
jgi:hypothetical protein